MMEALEGYNTALADGSIILGGQYRLVQLLQQRPRVNLYLGRRRHLSQEQGEKHEPLVAIRELVLTGLLPQIRDQIEQAAFEEFVSPVVLGSPRLPEAGDRVYMQGERLYLVMQLRGARGEGRTQAVTLAELLLSWREWPQWLEMETALVWGAQLCRIVARLHRLGVVLGNLDPATVVVDREGSAEWAPVLLVSWPPAPRFWPASAAEQYTQIFPIAMNSTASAFAAPETLEGVSDERSDVYALGAILYLLLTHYAPVSAALRQAYGDALSVINTESERGHNEFTPCEGIELIYPYLMNKSIPARLEVVLLRALALDPARRYASVFALAEALEAIDLKRGYTS